MEEFRRYEWEEYKTLLERLEYTEEQISAVKEIRENYESMTIDQFNATSWTGGMTARYIPANKRVRVIAVDFKEQLVGLAFVRDMQEWDEPYWARPENVDDISSAVRIPY
jgi:hypothetical protein